MTASRNFIVSRHVQGVGFRYATQRMAEQLELVGWVRNLPGGEVEAQASGDPQKLHEFESWLRVGPVDAQVTNLAVTDAVTEASNEVTNVANGFCIRP